MQDLNLIQQLIIIAPPLLLAITLHEVAHGWTALRFGDTTALAQGRLSLNPIRHIDPVGTVLVPIGLYVMSSLAGGSGFIFGWAKPVPVNTRQLRNPKRDMALVALAGPSANLAMALAWALIMLAGEHLYPLLPWLGEPLFRMGNIGVIFNIILGVLNMLPIPPLDGSRIMVGLLPHRFAILFARIEPFGLVILVLLLATGWLHTILWPPVIFISELIYSIFG